MDLARTAMKRPVVLHFENDRRAHAFVLKWGAFRKALQRHHSVDPDLAIAALALPAIRDKRGSTVTIKQADYFVNEITTALNNLETNDGIDPEIPDSD